eukprot:TRINITY_DN248_c0_g1_i9.p1 TRINITY_DN248_c0_g1~~TRINITY_DN248_c0_g1_i9.p1  ORF type:complete len:188 (-),score=34.88 TRINITY_DN248_c0_g1_i9:31-594(-)
MFTDNANNSAFQVPLEATANDWGFYGRIICVVDVGENPMPDEPLGLKKEIELFIYLEIIFGIVDTISSPENLKFTQDKRLIAIDYLVEPPKMPGNTNIGDFKFPWKQQQMTGKRFDVSMAQALLEILDALHRSLRKTPLILQKIENSPLQPDLLEHLAQVKNKLKLVLEMAKDQIDPDTAVKISAKF